MSSIKTTPMIIQKSWSIAGTKPTGSSEHEVNGGMTTQITVVDGVAGLTPDMLRAYTDGEPTTTPPTTLSTNWNSEMGTIQCSSCGATWPCHYAPWTAGSQNCTRCGTRDSLEWGPT